MTFEEFLTEWENGCDSITVHTSGSTGVPKPMSAEKSRMLSSARTTCDFLNLKKGDSALLCLPLDYIAGKMMVVRSIERGLLLTKVPPCNHPFSGMTEGFDLVALVPSQVYCTLQNDQETAVMKSCRNIIVGGGAVSRELEEALKNFPNAVWSSYGMTETLSHIALRRLNGRDRSDWYTAFDGVEINVNEDSCLVIDAPAVHKGILETNDIVQIAPDGRRFKVTGRMDNVICCGGVKLQIESIEETLSPHIPHPFCITKAKDPKFGEIPVLLLSDKNDCAAAEKAVQVLEKYSRAKRTVVVKSIPLTPTGKIDRAAALRLASNTPQTSE